ncbi:MAG: pitrilysin family protein [Pseudomonadota bacterium]
MSADAGMRLTRLQNGVRVVTDQMAHVDSAAIGIFVATGSRAERDDEHGLAHFLEHMAFKGTATRSARDISEEIERVGGEINASTSVETTAYHARVLSEDVPLALDILTDIVKNPRFDAQEVERERGVILQEIGAAEDMPEDRAFDAFPEAAFRGAPLGRRILGTRTAIEATSREALAAFFARTYAPNAMTVAAAGAVDHDAIVAALDGRLGDAPGGKPVDAARYTGGTVGEASDGAEAHVIVGFEGLPAAAKTSAAAQVAAVALGGGMASRLFLALREERGLVYDTSAFHWAFADTGVFALHFATGPETADEATAVALGALTDLSHRPGEAEVARAKAQLRAGLLMSRENCASRMGQAARSLIVHDRVLTRDERLETLAAVTPEDVATFLSAALETPPTLTVVGADTAALDARVKGSLPPTMGAA